MLCCAPEVRQQKDGRKEKIMLRAMDSADVYKRQD